MHPGGGGANGLPENFSIIQGESTLKGGYNYFPLNVGMLRTILFLKTVTSKHNI